MFSFVSRRPRLKFIDCHGHQAVHGRATQLSECLPAFARAINSSPKAFMLFAHDISWSGRPSQVAAMLWRRH
eukprot:10088087-Heterocapsa_arctica.AAC.1